MTLTHEFADELARLGTDMAARPYARRGVSMSDRTIRVILADDHAMVREGLRLLLRTAPDIAVVGEAGDGRGALALARQVEPDIVVLDLDMPGGDGAAALPELVQELPEVRVLILTVHGEHERLLPMLDAGARGYLTKEAASRDLVEAIRVVAGGEVYVRPAAARLLAGAVAPRPALRSAIDRFHGLSEREQTVLRAVAEGYSGAEIARHLGISTKTVDAYKRRIQDKLGLEHRTEYVRFAIEVGLLHL
ncbi:MAG TPA: response regulator transcription factor [Gemmatimonadales bacterium]|nr:response regulator transcription factor [Gemmatimonadales bacterium]